VKPERWRQIESLYNKAMELDAVQRTAFLREACGGDEDLQRDIEELLEEEPQGSFLEKPALREIAQEFAATAAPSWIGRQIGNYEFLSLAGAGGMGEVYRARDIKLKREVAVKILSEEFSRDPERVSRFQREAQLLATLNHPHIASIYNLEEADGRRFLILELVEGETVADRLKRGPVPLEEALTIALQIAEALEAAHEKNVIHRDLKPANIKVTAEGTVKVLDFGLAKTLAHEPTAEDIGDPPTNISIAATRKGVILGTAAYMSPEQATGKAVDRRTDIWAFGVVLYELLTGKPPFQGEDLTEILTAVLTGEPAHDALPAKTPAGIRNLLRRCLEKNLKRRVQHMGEARIVIQDALSGATPADPVAAPPKGRERLAWAAACVLMLTTVTFAIGFVLRAPKPSPPMHLSAEIGADESLYTNYGASAILSPDGTRLAFVASGADQKRRIYVRTLDALNATTLSGTENARNPFFSPDGQWLGFFADGKLKKVSMESGAAVVLCDAPDDRGGSWGEDGAIVFTANQTVGLSKVSKEGGLPEPLTTLDLQTGEGTHRWPQILPGGKAVLFTSNARTNNYVDSEIVVYSMASRQRKTVLRGGFYARYLRSGHIVYAHEGTLLAVPFDLQQLEVTGEPAPVLEGLVSNTGPGGAQFSFSETGNLAYVAGRAGPQNVSIDWMDRGGKLTPLRETPDNYLNPKFSPDGKRLALDISDGTRRDIWVYEWEHDNMKRLTLGGEINEYPVWTPDGQRIVYTTEEKDGAYKRYTLWWIRADGAGMAQRLAESKSQQYTPSWHPDGKVLAFRQNNADTGWDIMTLSIEGDEKSGWKPGEPKPFINGAFDERSPAFSPDGRWLAYMSNELGSYDLYVRAFPGPGGKWQISTGVSYPKWSRNGMELFYGSAGGKLMMVTYTASGDIFRFDKPQLWSPSPFTERAGNNDSFDIHPDGKRVAVLKASGIDQPPAYNKVSFILNFFDELRHKLPGKN
jgi:Tol biopolymer transport system component